ncbi:hypothetical protein HHK36_001741 [Tetracentron sinense]|uniref:CGL160/ATPI domain-containing protein n=1 Tax=Tetracentron sinense TaxID=13715 RepID=A0A835DSB0_TETSI|nr:hypothetical protein HHK36_001741 [Tetracentron sinense]
MAILNYISVNAAATPISQDSTTPPPDPRQTRIILPKKKPQKWSTGVAPGDYGGPPTTTKLRKYWGGEQEDPLTSDDFIWNREFMTRMKKLIQDPDSSSLQTPPAKEVPSGFLSLSRAMSLDSVEIDLSKELTAPSKPVLEQQVEAARRGLSASQNNGNPSPKWRPAPTRREQEKWDRATKAATGGSEVMFRELRKPKGDPKVLAAQAREQYFKLKQKLQTLTLGIGGIGLVSAYVSYSPEIAASFGAGFLGSLAYIRMLGNSVDSMADGAKGLIKVSSHPYVSARDFNFFDIGLLHLLFVDGHREHSVFHGRLHLIDLGIILQRESAEPFAKMEKAAAIEFGSEPRALDKTLTIMTLRGAIGQPRLLVPVALVMIYNRWNGILVPEYGFMHLDLIPMLVGFFTYKMATFIQAIEVALTVVEEETQVQD